MINRYRHIFVLLSQLVLTVPNSANFRKGGDHLRIKDVLIKVAKRKSVINYTDLLKQSGVHLDMSNPHDRGVLGNLLGDISWNEVQEGRPMLSSVALHAGDFKQGGGFFDLAEELYSISLPSADAELNFGMDEMNKTHEFWSK